MHGALHHHSLNTHPLNGDEFSSYIISGDLAADVWVGGDVDARAGVRGSVSATVWGVAPNVAALSAGGLGGSALNAAALHGNIVESRDNALLRGNAGIHGFFRVERGSDSGDLTGNTGIQGQVVAPVVFSSETNGQVGVQGSVHGSLVLGGTFSGVGGMVVSSDFAATSTTLAEFHSSSGAQGDFAATVRTPGSVEFAQTWGPLAGFALHAHSLHGWQTSNRPVAKALFSGTAGNQGFFRTQLDTMSLDMTGDTWLELQFSAPGAHTTATCTGQLGIQGELAAGLDGQASFQGDSWLELEFLAQLAGVTGLLELDSHLFAEFSTTLSPLTATCTGQLGTQGDVAAISGQSGLLTTQLGIQGDVAGAYHPIAPSGDQFAGRVGVQGGLAVDMDHLVLEIAGQLGVNASVLAALSPNLLHLLGQLGIQGDVAGVLLILGLFTPLDIRVVRGESRFPFVQAGMSTMTFDRDVATIFPGVEIDDLPFYNPILDEAFIHAG